MNLKQHKYSLQAFLYSVFCVSLLVSCTDEVKNSTETDERFPSEAMPCVGYELGLPVVLDAADEPSAVDELTDYDDYVETKDHFRVFFFDKDGKFLVNTMDRTVTPLGTDNQGRKKFYVRIPVNYIVDRKGNIIDVEEFKSRLKKNSFKVAILANWPNPEGSTDENATFDEKNPRFPNWGWEESCLNPNVVSPKTINDLHHLIDYQTGIYSSFTKEGKISNTVDWVDNEGKGKQVSENFLIPMYGVQDYPALTDWEEGSTYNLSGISDVDDNAEKNIYLLRSVAKIEIYLPKEAAEIKIHNINKSARCEPMDVFTPTNKIWLKEDNKIYHTSKLTDVKNNLKELCEWYRIGNKGLFCQSQSTDYAEWLEWFYKAWSEDGSSSDGLARAALTDNPHIFNENVDNVEMVDIEYVRSTEEGELYVIYMPEKYMDHPSDLKSQDSNPVIPYVELKYKAEDSYSRFYLTDDQPESTRLQDVVQAPLWPIMRNHVYKFYVREQETSLPTILEIRARVAEWNYEKIINDKW